MKKNFFYLSILMGIVTFNACGSGEDDVTKEETPEETTPSINIADAQDLQFGQEKVVDDNAQTISIAFSTNMDWTLTAFNTNGGWCTPSISSGSKGNSSITFTISANEDSEDRTSSFTLACGSLSKNIVITQKGRNTLTLSTSRFDVPLEGGEIDVQVLSNVDYTIELPEEYSSWIHRNATRATTSITHNSFTVDASEEYDKREAILLVKSSLGEEEIHVYQVGNAFLALSASEMTIDAKGGEIAIEVRSNYDYNVEMPDVSWLHLRSSRSITTSNLLLYADENKDSAKRSAQIVLSDSNSDKKEVITIIQNLPAIGKINGYEYVDLGLPSGTLWATCNLGASKKEGYGYYYAWGETKPKSSYTDSNHIFYDSSISAYKPIEIGTDIAGTNNDAATVNHGKDWQMPSYSQMKELRKNCTWTRENMKGVVGYTIVGPSGYSIFLPCGGCINGTYEFKKGIQACYRTSTFAFYSNSMEPLNWVLLDNDVTTQGLFWGMNIRPVHSPSSDGGL